MKGCCAPQDIAVGLTIGAGMGAGWYFLAREILNPKFYPNDEGSLFFFSGPFGMQTCSVDSKKRFKCVYDDNSGKPFNDDEIPEEEE